MILRRLTIDLEMTSRLASAREFFRRLFSSHEIENSRFLQFLYWPLLIGFFLSFQLWIRADFTSRSLAQQGRHICPPYFTNCGSWYWFERGPGSYSQDLFFTALFALLVLSAVFAWQKRWWLAQLLMVPLTFFKIFYVYFFTYGAVVEYEYFHIPVVLVYLFAAHKEFFVRRVFVLVYVLSATMKFREAWIIGSYFSSLKLGLPIFPDSWIPYITNGVVLFEIFAPWFLLSFDRRLRLTSLATWIVFHLYSVPLVGIPYPAFCIPLLLALFLPDPEPNSLRVELSRRTAIGWAMMSVLVLLTALPLLIPGHNDYSMQGRRFGAQMFDANHQCFSEATIVWEDGREKEITLSSFGAMSRCSPYTRYFRLKQQCEKSEVASIRWAYDSSINGGPFYRIVESHDACVLKYNVFANNDWIKSPETGAPVVGYPRKNLLYASRAPEPMVYPHPDPSLRVSSQGFFIENFSLLRIFYWLLWFATCAYFCLRPWIRSSR